MPSSDRKRRRALFELGGLTGELARLTGERDDLIRKAKAAGANVPDIARAAGLGTRRVWQILKG